MSKILIVEDDEQLLFILSKTLDNAGYQTLIATNGEKAITILKQNPDIELVITDLVMPVLDGVQLCNYIRNDKTFENLSILIITGQTDIYYKAQGFDAGADDFITKPVEYIEFMLRVKALLKRTTRYSGKSENLIRDSEKGAFNESKNLLNKNYMSFLTKSNSNVVIDKNNSTIMVGDNEIYLTSTELEIILYLYNKKREPSNSEELLEKIMDYLPGSGNPVAIRTHIRNIRAKMEVEPNNPQIIINIPKRGYILNIDFK
jgi:DNA-binding response OmpR family regulator